MKIKIVNLVCIAACFLSCSSTYNDSESELAIMFWNLENFFDCIDDPLTNDEEFTPFGERNWNSIKYNKKSVQVWKTIFATDDHPPDVVALCEIENRDVLEDIFIHSPLGKFNYELVHKDSPDMRGMDVALAYNSKNLNLIYSEIINIDLSKAGGGTSRDILYTVFTYDNDEFHLFVNHWPSKYGGTGVTENFRKIAAETLIRKTDSISLAVPEAAIICMGDFNDVQESASIQILLRNDDESNDSKLIMAEVHEGFSEGTLKYQGSWEKIDHFIVSSNFYDVSSGFFLDEQSCRIFAPDFLLERDEKYGGFKPFRTWSGFSYNGGASDHLPVLLRVTRPLPTAFALRSF